MSWPAGTHRLAPLLPSVPPCVTGGAGLGQRISNGSSISDILSISDATILRKYDYMHLKYDNSMTHSMQFFGFYFYNTAIWGVSNPVDFMILLF